MKNSLIFTEITGSLDSAFFSQVFLSNRSTNTNEQTTRSGTNEKISILDEDSRTIGGGSCYNKERGALGGSGSLVSRAIARFNNDTKHILTASDEKQETSSKKYTFQKSNSSGSIKRGQSLKIPASYTGNSSTDHQVNSGTGSKSCNSAMLTNSETQNSVSSTNSKYQGSDDAQDYSSYVRIGRTLFECSEDSNNLSNCINLRNYFVIIFTVSRERIIFFVHGLESSVFKLYICLRVPNLNEFRTCVIGIARQQPETSPSGL